jgi:rubrerythrin
VPTLPPDPRASLVRLLQLAYSGEKAAAAVYRHHAASVRDPAVRDQILKIEGEENHHRDLVGGMLAALGEGPDPRRERRAARIGSTLGPLCHWTGYLAPMLGAGFLESRNVKEYEDAAAYAAACGHPEFIDCLRAMAAVEAEHEAYFRERVEAHRLGRFLPLWKRPAPAAR